MVQTYDFIVLGGGTGGLRLALAAVRQGKRTLLIEAGKIGGTCLNNGCIPTKAMLEAAHRYKSLEELNEFGIKTTKSTVNISKLLQRVNGIVSEGQSHIKKGLKNSKLEVVKGKGVFIGKKQIQVGKEIYSAKKIVIATGSKNIVPQIEGIQKVTYLTNENILRLKALPKSIALIGAGYISMEFTTFFAHLGVKVTMLEFADTILGMLDDDVVKALETYYVEKGVIIKKGVQVTQVSKVAGKYVLTYRDVHNKSSAKLTVEQLMVATGRKPNTSGLDLGKTNVKVGSRGEILVNEKLQTNVCGIYAMGDVIGHDMFAHAVKRESDIILHNAFHMFSKKMDFTFMPWAVFTNPIVAGVGLSEKQADEKNVSYEILRANFKNVGKAKIINDQRGFLKIIYHPLSKRIYGATCIGPSADIIIHEVIALMNSKNPSVEVLKKSIHIHPTLSEIFSVLK